MKTTTNLIRLFAGASLTAMMAASSALAASGAWIGNTDATWTNIANWSASPVPGTGDTATFNSAATFQTVDLGSGVTVSNLTFDTSSAGAYTIGSGAVGSQALTLNSALGGISLSSTVTSNQTLNANVAMAATGAYNFFNGSANSLTLAGTNSAASTGIKVMRVGGAGNTTISGPIVSGTGTMNLEKTNSGTLTLSGGAKWDGNGVNCYLPGSTLVPADLRQGTTIITGGTYTNNGEFVIGGVIANGGAGNNVNFTMNGGSLGVGSWFSLGRGNGIGGVSSDAILNNNASVVAGNISAGFNANAANLPKGSLTLNNSSSFTVLGNGAMNFAESPGSDMTINLNNSSGFTNLGTAQKFLGELGNGTVNLNDSSSMILGNGIANIGYRSGTGVVNVAGSAIFQNAGDLRIAGSDVNGTGNNGFGTLNMSGGTVAVGSLTMARGNNNQNGVSGLINLNGGTFISTNDCIIGYAGTGTAQIVINGGNFNIGPTAGKWFMPGWYDTTKAEIDITNGTLNLMNGSAIKFDRQNTPGPNVINQIGGSVNFYSDAGVTFGGAGNLDLQYAGVATSTNTYNLNGGTLTVPQVISTATTGTRFFNFNGGTLKPTASSATFFNLGSGNAFANVRAGGAVIDSGANNITIVSLLQHSTISGDPDPDGGLTKTGVGTLTLGGGYSYTGPTKVLGGGLSLNTSGTVPSSGGDLTASNATLNLTTTSGTAVPAANVSLQGSNVLNLALNSAPDSSATCINASGTLANTGTNIINISGSGLTFGVYHLISTSGLVGTNNFVLGILPVGVKGVLTNSTSTSLDFLVTTAGQDLSWYGFDGSGYSTIWDIGITTDWTPDHGSSLTAYNQYLGNTVGDRVTFGVDGINTTDTNYVNLTTAVVPAAVTFNWVYPYVLSGAGSIGGITSLVVTNAPSVVLLTSNSYTGGTFLYGGTLAITNDNALGATAGAVTLSGGALLIGDGASSSRNINQTANSSVGATSVSGVKSGTLSGNITGTGSLTKVGNGALTLSGNITNTAIINNGTGGALTLSSNVVNSGTSQFLNGTGVISGTLTVGGELWVGNGSGVSSVVNVQPGALVTVTSWIPVGRNSANGILNVNGGTVVKAGDNTTHLTMGGVGSGQTGTINLNSGNILDATGDAWLGEDNTCIVNQNGGLLANTGGSVYMGRANAANSTYNLNGGTLQTRSIVGFGGASTSVFNFNGGTLQPLADSAAFVQGLTHAYVTTNGAVINTTNNITIPQVLENDPSSGPGALVKLGTGSLTLSGSNTFSGPMLVSQGTLALTPAIQGANPVTVAGNANLNVTEGSAATIGNLTVSNNSVISIVLTYGTNPVAPVLNVNALNFNGTAQVRLTGTINTGTMIPLIGFNSIGGAGGFNPVVTGLQGLGATLATNGNTLVINVTSVPGIVWSGTNNALGKTNVWDLNSTTNWLALGAPTDYQETTPPGDAVTFNDIGTGTVLLSNTVSPNSVVISNSAVNYTISGTGGQINSTAGLAKLGSGSATLNVPGTYSGSTVISNGVISLGANQTFANLSGSGAVTTASGSPTLTVNSTADTVFAGTLQGTLGLTKTGNATLTLTASNSLGSATVSAGTLQLQNSNAAAGSTLTLGGGGTLSLRSDVDTTFANTNFTMATGGANNILVNALTGAGSGRTITITSNAALGNGNTTINVTSTNSDTLVFGNSFGVSANGSTAWGGPETAFNLNGANVILNGMFASDGGMSVSSGTGNTLTVNGSVSYGNARTIYAKVNSGTLILNDTDTGGHTGANWGFFANLNGGTLCLNSANAINGNSANGHYTLLLNSGTLDNTSGAALTETTSPTVGLNGDFMFAGTASLNLGTGNVYLNASHQITVSASTLTLGGIISDNGSGYGLTKAGSGALTLNGVNTYTGPTVVNGGVLGGVGAIAGAVTVNSGATLAPGGNFNTLTIGGDLTLNTGSTNVFEVNGSTSANDTIALGGNATYGGVLSIVPSGTFTNGQTFTLFSGAGAASASNFDSVVDRSDSGLVFAFANGILTVTGGAPVGPSGPEALTSSYDAVTHTLSLSWPAGENWRLQMQTNSLSKGLGTNWQYITDGTISSTNITVDPSQPTVFYRLAYP